jgi:hypothetical protein
MADFLDEYGGEDEEEEEQEEEQESGEGFQRVSWSFE